MVAKLDTKEERHHVASLPPAFYGGMYVVTSVNEKHANTDDKIKTWNWE